MKNCQRLQVHWSYLSVRPAGYLPELMKT